MPTYGKDIHKLVKVIEALRNIDKEMPLQMAQCFLEIALNPGLTMQQLGEATDLSQSSASRNVQTLGKWHRIGKPGYDLVEAVEDPVDTRRKIMFLTPKGRTLIASMLGTLRDEPVKDFETKASRDAIKSGIAERQARYAAR